MDHDRLFKELLRTFFAEFIELFLPEVAAYLDRASLEFLDKEVFTDVTAGDRHEVDLLAKARFRGREAFFLVHVETQASAEEAFAGRMFRYFARLHEKFGLPVYPIALFSYDAPLRPEPERYRVEFPDRVVLDFAFHVIQLNRLNWRDFARRPNPVAAALMAKMRIAPEDRPRVKLECLRLIVTLKLDPARQTLIRGFMGSYLKLKAEEEKVYYQEIQQIDPPEREVVMEFIDEWEKIGVMRGQAQMISKLFRRRFGKITVDLHNRIGQLSYENLEALSDALLDFQTLAEVDDWVAQHE